MLPLYSSIHCYLDPSSGAALCTRELLELLAGWGMDCRVLTTGILDPERETSLDEVFATLELPARRFLAELGLGRAAEVIDLSVNGVRVTLMPTSSQLRRGSPDPRESTIFLELAEQVFDRFRPDVLLTYGGHPASPNDAAGTGGICRCRRTCTTSATTTAGPLPRRLGRDLPVGILPPPPCPAAGRGWSGHPGPDPADRLLAADPRRNMSRASIPSRPRAWPSSRIAVALIETGRTSLAGCGGSRDVRRHGGLLPLPPGDQPAPDGNRSTRDLIESAPSPHDRQILNLMGGRRPVPKKSGFSRVRRTLVEGKRDVAELRPAKGNLGGEEGTSEGNLVALACFRDSNL